MGVGIVLYIDQKLDLFINVKLNSDFELNNFIKNELKLASNVNSTKYNIIMK